MRTRTFIRSSRYLFLVRRECLNPGFCTCTRPYVLDMRTCHNIINMSCVRSHFVFLAPGRARICCGSTPSLNPAKSHTPMMCVRSILARRSARAHRYSTVCKYASRCFGSKLSHTALVRFVYCNCPSQLSHSPCAICLIRFSIAALKKTFNHVSDLNSRINDL